MKLSLLVATFPYGATEHPDVRNYLVSLNLQIERDGRFHDVSRIDVDDTPVTMSRNRALKRAQDKKIDLVLMVDSDMKPDMYAGYPGSKPFFWSSLDFMLKQPGPCVVAAPYGGPPPHENCYVFQWSARESNHPNCDLRLEQYSREEAAVRGGIEEVAALPTGLILIDTRCVEALTPPWFEYEYDDPPFNTRKATTEDVYFTRNCSLAGVPVYCNWDSWAGHWKRKCVGRPELLTCDGVRESFREALLSGRRAGERLVEIRPGGI